MPEAAIDSLWGFWGGTCLADRFYRRLHTLSMADLYGANLHWADLLDAKLIGANLKATRLLDVEGLNQSQLNEAGGNARTETASGV
jgi:uncharacterized protein YjbI with pentapeptide repeats